MNTNTITETTTLTDDTRQLFYNCLNAINNNNPVNLSNNITELPINKLSFKLLFIKI